MCLMAILVSLLAFFMQKKQKTKPIKLIVSFEGTEVTYTRQDLSQIR